MEKFVSEYNSSSEEENDTIEEQASLKPRKNEKCEWKRCETYPNKKDAIVGKQFLGHQTARSQTVRPLQSGQQTFRPESHLGL